MQQTDGVCTLCAC